MSDIEIMEFPYGAFLKLRLEFVLLRDNELEARIMRIIEGWMIDQKKAWQNACTQAASDGKPIPPEPDYFVTLSYAQIIAQLYMFNSSRKGEGKGVIKGKKNSISRNTLARAIASLTTDEYITVRPNPDKTKEYDAAQYTLNIPLIQEHMKLLPNNPMAYLGSNGHKDGKPRQGDAQKTSIPPRTKNEHPTQNESASPRTFFGDGDAQNSHILIDISNRDTNRMEEGTSADDSANPNALPSSSHSSALSVSLQDIPTQDIIAEVHRRELEQLSTPDVDKVDPPVDKQANGVEQPSSHIANETTPIQPSTQRNTEPLVPPKLSEEEQRIDGYWQQIGFISRPSAQKHWKTLSKHVHSFEDMQSLYNHTESQIENDPSLNDKTVNPGNLANAKYLDGWKQKKRKAEKLAEPAKARSIADPLAKMKATAAQFMTQGVN